MVHQMSLPHANVSPHTSFLATETEYALGTRPDKWHNKTSDHESSI